MAHLIESIMVEEPIKIKFAEEVIVVAPDEVELATPTISTDGKNIIATQEQKGGYVPTETKTATIPATSLEENLKPENILKGESIFGVEGEAEFKAQTKTITITENGTEEVGTDEGYDGISSIQIATDVHPTLQEKTAEENGEIVADEGFDGLSKVSVNVQPKLQEKTATENGTIEADAGYDGLKKVDVNVNPPLQAKTVELTENGSQTVTADEPNYGLSEVKITVDVNPELQEKEVEITENGTTEIVADEGVYGLKEVSVTVDVKPNLQDKTVELAESGTTEIVADEGYDGLGKVEVVANIASGDEDTLTQLIANELESYSNENATTVRYGLFYECTSLSSVDFPNATSIKDYAFLGCDGLSSVNFPNVTSIGTQTFRLCGNLVSVNFPSAKTIGQYCFRDDSNLATANFPNVTSLSSYAFEDCSNLSQLVLGELTSIGSQAFIQTTNLVIDFVAAKVPTIDTSTFSSSGIKSYTGPFTKTIGMYSFRGCPNLTKVDIGESLTSAGTISGSYAFQNSENLTSLIIRTPGYVWKLSVANAFGNTPIESGTGYIYVPDDLVDSYKAATNWSTFADQIKPISELPTE